MSFVAIVLLAVAALSGCEALRTIDSFDGILAGKMSGDPEVEMLDRAETAFFSNNFELAESLYRRVQQNTEQPEYKNQAYYGLSCVAIITADNLAELQKAFSEIDRWQRPQREVGGDGENPEMLVVALHRKADLLNCDSEIKVVTTEKKKEVNREQQLEIEQLKQTIQKLKHQISVLEAIDQEIQEKRKPI